MHKNLIKRTISIFLTLALSLGLMPMTANTVKAISTGVDTLDCSSFISNEEHRNYINLMMQYYIASNSELKTALDNGKSVVFMFEGGSDNFPSNAYSSSSSNIRNQAVAIVVQKVNGVYKITFYSENCSSLPSQPQDTSGGSCDRQTTILDGIYKIRTCNHLGQYGALNVVTDKGYYTPSINQDGWTNSASGINIHTRSTNTAGSGNNAWSWGCQLIGNGGNSSNVFNEFMKIVTGIDYNVWTKYSSNLDKITSGKDVGYYVLDRQLAMDGLSAMYTSKALKNITQASKTAYDKAQATYEEPLIKSTYPCHGLIEIISDTTYVKSLPCSKKTDPKSTDVEVAAKGDFYIATGLYRNSADNLWYQVKTSDGTVGYIYSGDTEYIGQETSDLKLSGASIPTEIEKGKTFAVKGIISTEYQKLSNVSVWVKSNADGSKQTGKAIDVNTNRYDISHKDIDYNVKFDKLAAGAYTYIIGAGVTSHYAKNPKEYASVTVDVILHESDFLVVDDSVCKHSYDSVVTAPTCTAQGYTTYTCKCGDTYTADYVKSTGHTFTDWLTIIEPTVDKEGEARRVCACGEIESKVLEKLESELPKLGDVNNDGKLNAKDATMILRYAVGKLTDVPAYFEQIADVNGDGKVNAKDATLILRYVVGKAEIPGWEK